MEIEFASPGAVEGEALSAVAVPVFDGLTLTASGEALDQAVGGAISRALAGARFTGAKGQTLDIVAPSGVHAARIVLAGAGPRGELASDAIEGLAASAYQAVKTSGVTLLELRLADLANEDAARAALGA